MLIVGAKGHAVEVLQCLTDTERERAVFFDDTTPDLSGDVLGRYPILRSAAEARAYLAHTDSRFVLGLGGAWSPPATGHATLGVGWAAYLGHGLYRSGEPFCGHWSWSQCYAPYAGSAGGHTGRRRTSQCWRSRSSRCRCGRLLRNLPRRSHSGTLSVGVWLPSWGNGGCFAGYDHRRRGHYRGRGSCNPASPGRNHGGRGSGPAYQ